MSEQAYRQRLETDLLRWQTEGVIAPSVRDAIRATFRPLPAGVDVTTVVAILGGLLIAAAFLAFIAANWTGIARPLRFLMLLAGIAGAYGAGAFFAYKDRPYLADIGATVGSIVFGAAVALVGQMYHLGDDFAGGMALWATGALAAAILTKSRGALAVALAAGCVWNGARTFEVTEIQFLFAAYCLVGAGLAVAWDSPAARHLVSIAALGWWIAAGVSSANSSDPFFVYAFSFGTSLLFGSGLALMTWGPEALRKLGSTLSDYCAFAFAVTVSLVLTNIFTEVFGSKTPSIPMWMQAAPVLGIVLSFVAAGISRRAGPALVGFAMILGLAAILLWERPQMGHEPWLSYVTALAAMLCLVVSGVLDDRRPRLVAGWLGLAAAIAAITWSVQGSLLRRAAFLSVTGAIAIAFALVLSRLRKERLT